MFIQNYLQIVIKQKYYTNGKQYINVVINKKNNKQMFFNTKQFTSVFFK